MNITDLLKEDHRKAESLISQLEGEANHETFGRLITALKMHTRIEEEIYYPALEEFEESDGLIDDAYHQHNDVDQLLEEMGAVGINSRDFKDLLMQLKESINNHVQEEEEEIFPLSENLLRIEIMEEMGENAFNLKSNSSAIGYPKN